MSYSWRKTYGELKLFLIAITAVRFAERLN